MKTLIKLAPVVGVVALLAAGGQQGDDADGGGQFDQGLHESSPRERGDDVDRTEKPRVRFRTRGFMVSLCSGRGPSRGLGP